MIRRLITHGCSFTYGEELADPALSSWPRLVADHFDMELLNLAQPAYSNDLMIEDLVKAEINQNDLVIVGWTSHLRVGLKDPRGWYSVRPNARDNTADRKVINDLLVKNLDTDWLLDRWMQQVILIQCYLENIKAQYLFISAFDNLNNLEFNHPLIEKIKADRFIGWPDKQMVEMVYRTPLAPRGHPSESGHAAISKNVIFYSQKLYGLQPKN